MDRTDFKELEMTTFFVIESYKQARESANSCQHDGKGQQKKIIVSFMDRTDFKELEMTTVFVKRNFTDGNKFL